MRPMRRSWGVVGLVVLTAVLAVAFAQPVLLGATVTIGGWLLARQYRFARAVSKLPASLSVEQSLTPTGVREGGVTTVTLAVDSDPTFLRIACTAGLPMTVTAHNDPTESVTLSITLEPGASRAARTVSVTSQIAGRHSFEPATVTVTDGWFRETFSAGSTPALTVEPRRPRDIHIGSGGDRIALPQGRHESDRRGGGLTPAELREYLPGDTADTIDWKATARLGTPHVREYEGETNRPTILVVDHRSELATGPPGETKVDYLRAGALTVAASAQQLDDPIGLFTVGNEGVTSRFEPVIDPVQYRRIRRELLELEAMTPLDADRTERAGSPMNTSGTRRGVYHEPTDTRSALRMLDAHESSSHPFVRTLLPFYRTRQQYWKRFAVDPLYGTLQTAFAGREGRPWTVICTDDSQPEQLRKSIQLARENRSELLLLLTPTVLFEPDSLTEIERTYERYLEFERFRRTLDRLEGVTALEVAPGDRLSTVLTTERASRRMPANGGETR